MSISTRSQMRAARALLGWSQLDLASRAGVSLPTIKRLEPGDEVLTGSHQTIEAIRRALEDAGVIFVAENGEGPGVRLRKARPE
ncbi:helix-turn-helix domain-containing protein [Bosea massiliensis]|uniref:Helix-turn-helix domain-containing protein n=1 Tax=Bosea massiliensis TaxID=151419 RepID=A0ABW0NYJ0_9HYPH